MVMLLYLHCQAANVFVVYIYMFFFIVAIATKHYLLNQLSNLQKTFSKSDLEFVGKPQSIHPSIGEATNTAYC